MCRHVIVPNLENSSLSELALSMKLAPTVKSYRRLQVIHFFVIGFTQQQIALAMAMRQRTVPMCNGDPFATSEEETDDFKLIEFVLDASGSMDLVQNELRDSFNEVIMPGLLGGAAPQVGAIRFGGLKFDDHIVPLWGGGFKRLNDKFPKLTTSDYSAGGSTALHQAVLDGVTALAGHALQIQQRTGTPPECVLVVLSDVDFAVIARNLGFREVMHSKAPPGETPEQQKKRMRNVMKVFSANLVNRASTSQVGKSTGNPTASTGFWTP